MIDINLIRKTPDVVRENIKKKFQDSKLPLVDEVIELDRKNREAMQQADNLRNQRKDILEWLTNSDPKIKGADEEKLKAAIADFAKTFA